jgi:hypothetical protein
VESGRVISTIPAPAHGGDSGLAPHGMMPCRLDLEMKWGHVIDQADFHKIVGVATGFHAMLGCAIKDTRESIHGLQEGRHAKVVQRN